MAAISAATACGSRSPSITTQRSAFALASDRNPWRRVSWKPRPKSSNRSSPDFRARPRDSGPCLVSPATAV